MLELLRESGKLSQVEKEMKEYRLGILGLSEVRWPEFGELQTRNGFTFLYSGQAGEDAEHRQGVGIMLTSTAKNSLVDWKPISERLMMARFKAKVRNVMVIQCYAPTEGSEVQIK
jgi:exonuclease III